jgi:hypothetical protein
MLATRVATAAEGSGILATRVATATEGFGINLQIDNRRLRLRAGTFVLDLTV